MSGNCTQWNPNSVQFKICQSGSSEPTKERLAIEKATKQGPAPAEAPKAAAVIEERSAKAYSDRQELKNIFSGSPTSPPKGPPPAEAPTAAFIQERSARAYEAGAKAASAKPQTAPLPKAEKSPRSESETEGLTRGIQKPGEENKGVFSSESRGKAIKRSVGFFEARAPQVPLRRATPGAFARPQASSK